MSHVETFALPDVGEGLTEAEILGWRVAPGDEVGVNQILVEIETAKAAVELPSPFAGRVASLLVTPGQTVDVGVPIITIDTDPSSTGGPTTNGAATDEVGTQIGELTADGRIATLVGLIPAEPGTGRRPRKVESVADPVPTPAPAVRRAAPLAAPPVRLLARELGVDLHTVAPTGPDGLITRADVQQASAPAAVTVDPVVPPTPARSGADPSRQRRVPIRGVRKATGAAMVASAFTAPHVTVFHSVDVTETMALRQRLRARPEFADVKLTPLAFVARAVCLALRRSQDLNATWDEAAQEIVFNDYINLGIAAATPRGLVVPHIADAGALDLRGLAGALAELTETARAGRTAPAAMSGGTFTITNIGVFGIDAGTPILNPGEAGILAVGSIKPTPWVVDGELAVRQVCQLSLSFDHRLVDGAQGARFLADVSGLLGDPGLAFAW